MTNVFINECCSDIVKVGSLVSVDSRKETGRDLICLRRFKKNNCIMIAHLQDLRTHGYTILPSLSFNMSVLDYI